MAKPKIAIVGGGAAGVFTAYLLEKQAPGHFEIKILEKNSAVGGHAHSVEEQEGSETVSIDYGAQFFSETVQPDYTQMLKDEALFGVPGLIIEKDVGITIFDATKDELLFRIPNNVLEILVAALGDVVNWLCFGSLISQAKELYEKNDWTITFGDWIDDVGFWFANDTQTNEFKANIMRPLMYQFGLVPPDELDTLSAKFVVYYFLGSLPAGLDLTPFTIYNSAKGLDGIHEMLVGKYGLTVEVEKEVASIAQQGSGYVVTASDGTTYAADEVVFANNPNLVATRLPADAKYDDLRNVLNAMDFANVLIRIQKGTPSYMPTDPDDWSVSNVIVADTDLATEAPSHYMLSVWFGPVRDSPLGQKFFKSWGSPSLHPVNAPTHAQRHHQLMIGTPAFIAARDALHSGVHQGVHDLWFVGGYIRDYDSQNACLRSAQDVVIQILAKHGLPLTAPLALMRPDELAEWEASAETLDAREYELREPPIPAHFPLQEAIENLVTTLMPSHPAVQEWLKGSPDRSDAAE